eukprot:13649943-Heterocapsa_arctica.AAC.1
MHGKPRPKRARVPGRAGNTPARRVVPGNRAAFRRARKRGWRSTGAQPGTCQSGALAAGRSDVASPRAPERDERSLV